MTKAATDKLREFKVTLRLGTKINGEAKLPDGRTELSFSDGEKTIADLYIPTTGLTPNSSYAPQNLLNANGFVLVDEFLRVKGTTDVWAVGDVSSVQRPQLVNVEKQSAHVVKNIGLLMQGKELIRYSTNNMGMNDLLERKDLILLTPDSDLSGSSWPKGWHRTDGRVEGA